MTEGGGGGARRTAALGRVEGRVGGHGGERRRARETGSRYFHRSSGTAGHVTPCAHWPAAIRGRAWDRILAAASRAWPPGRRHHSTTLHRSNAPQMHGDSHSSMVARFYMSLHAVSAACPAHLPPDTAKPRSPGRGRQSPGLGGPRLSARLIQPRHATSPCRSCWIRHLSAENVSLLSDTPCRWLVAAPSVDTLSQCQPSSRRLFVVRRQFVLNISYQRQLHLRRIVASEHIAHELRLDLHLHLHPAHQHLSLHPTSPPPPPLPPPI